MSNRKTPAPNEVLKKFPSLNLPLSHHSLLWRKSIKKARMERPPTSAMETISIVNLRRRGKEKKETQKLFENWGSIMDFLPDLSILPVNEYQNAMQTAKYLCDGRRREQARWHRLPSWRQSTLVCTVEFRHYAIILPSRWLYCNIARSEGMKRRSFFISVILSLFDENDNNSTQSTATATRLEENKKESWIVNMNRA